MCNNRAKIASREGIVGHVKFDLSNNPHAPFQFGAIDPTCQRVSHFFGNFSSRTSSHSTRLNWALLHSYTVFVGVLPFFSFKVKGNFCPYLALKFLFL